MPKVSIIIPLYNLGEYLDEAVYSVLNQTYHDFEIIIVNDGSTDEYTINLLKEYNKPKTKIYHTKNQGLPATRNYGIERANGEYICCLDADDKYHPNFIDKCVSVLENDNQLEYGIVTTYFKLFENGNDVIKVIDFNPFIQAVENRLHVASLFRKKCWDEVGGYSTNLSGYQDWDFWIAIIAKGYKWFTIKDILFFYRKRTGSMLSNSDKNKWKLISQIVLNNYDFYSVNFHEIINAYVNINGTFIQNYQINQEFITQYDNILKDYQNIKKEYNTIRDSIAWKITKKIIKLTNVLFPPKSSQRKIIRKFFKKSINIGKNKNKILKRVNRLIHTNNMSYTEWAPDVPLVSVIIPCYNYGLYVEEAIDSVLSQTFQNYEIIVVDGGSTDNYTHSVLKKIDKPKTKIYFRDGRHLVGDNRNFGIELARGKYICCLDADDLIESTYLEKALFFLEAYNYDVVYPSVQCFGDKNSIWEAVPTVFSRMIKEGNFVSTVSLFKKKAWENAGKYKDWPVGKDHVPEDWEFWTRMMGYGYRFKPLPEPLMLYRVHGAGLTGQCGSTKEEQAKVIYNENKYLFNKTFKKLRKRNNHFYLVNNRFINLRRKTNKKTILLVLPFMIMGGADSILIRIFNFLKKYYDVVIITTMKSPLEYGDNTPEYKKITKEVYHLEEFLLDSTEKKDFIDYLITTRSIKCIFNVGSEFLYKIIPDIKKRDKTVIVIDQLFNEFGHIKNNRKNNKSIDLSIVANTKIQEILLNRFKEDRSKVKVIIHGVDVEEEYNPDIVSKKYNLTKRNKSKLTISYFGRFSHEKSPDLFVEIVNRLDNKNFDVVMTGNGPAFSETLKLIEKYGLADRIKTPGIVDDIIQYHVQTDILVVPSRIEGLPIVILEALSLGIPVIASNIGGIPTVINSGYNGYTCEVGDIDDFAEKINFLERDRSLLEKMKKNARAFAVENISEEKMNSEYFESIKNLIGVGN